MKVSFWDKLEKQPNGCWLWTGQRNRKGYGRLTVNKKDWTAHRYAFFLTSGKLPSSGLDVMHLCHTPPCCNPEHLRLGSRKENIRMSATAGRMSRGMKHSFRRGKLTPKTLAEVRRRAALGESQRKIAASLGLHQTTICKALTGTTYSGK